MTILVTYVLAAATACTGLVFMGRRGRSGGVMPAGHAWAGVLNDPLWAEEEMGVTGVDRQADVACAIRAAVRQMSPGMMKRLRKLELAASPGLRVRMEPAVLTDLLLEALTVAINRAPGSRLLLSASRRGDRVHVGITDDLAGPNRHGQSDELEALTARVALLGGMLDIDVHSTEGTTMTLRLAVPLEVRTDREVQPVIEEPVMERSRVASVQSV